MVNLLRANMVHLLPVNMANLLPVNMANLPSPNMVSLQGVDSNNTALLHPSPRGRNKSKPTNSCYRARYKRKGCRPCTLSIVPF